MDAIIEAFKQVMQSSFFWGSMGFTTAISMFIGVLLYNGNMAAMNKGFLNVVIYVGFILFTTFARISPRITALQDHNLTVRSQLWYGVATILYVSIAYLIGLFLGVCVYKWQVNRRK